MTGCIGQTVALGGGRQIACSPGPGAGYPCGGRLVRCASGVHRWYRATSFSGHRHLYLACDDSDDHEHSDSHSAGHGVVGTEIPTDGKSLEHPYRGSEYKLKAAVREGRRFVASSPPHVYRSTLGRKMNQVPGEGADRSTRRAASWRTAMQQTRNLSRFRVCCAANRFPLTGPPRAGRSWARRHSGS